MTDTQTTGMILATQSTRNTCQIPEQLTSMAVTGSISRRISMVPTTGQTSPTTVLVDVTADCCNGVSELKRIQDYSNQLFLPEEMVYENDLIKVWSIEEEQMAAESNQTMTRIHEDPTYNKASVTLAGPESTKERVPMTITFPPQEMDEAFLEEEMDDLFLALSPTARTSMAPKLPPAPLLSPMPLPQVSPSIPDSGNIKMVVIDDSAMSFNQKVPAKTRPSRGHRRGHRRNQSHFDFQFT